MHPSNRSQQLPTPVSARPIRVAFTFTCCSCGMTENRPTPDAPAGWVIDDTEDGAVVFCPQDAPAHPVSDLQ